MKTFFLAFVCAASHAIAVPITVDDYSFENNDLSAGDWEHSLSADWDTSEDVINEYIVGFSGESTDHFGATNGAEAWQDLGVTYQANTRYTLTISMGNRSGYTDSGNLTTYILADSTGTIYATGTANAYAAVSAGNFDDAPELIFDTPDDTSAIGKTIRIHLVAGGSGRSHFDNIRLTEDLLAPTGTATLQNNPATAIGSSTVTLNGEVLSTGSDAPAITIFYGTSDGGTNPASWDSSIALSGTQSSTFSSNITGLSLNTTYFFSARAINSTGTSWADSAETFATIPLPATLVNLSATSVTGTTAKVGADVTNTGGDTPTVTIYYGTTDGGTDIASWTNSVSLGSLSGSDTKKLSALSVSTTYYFRAYATNDGGSSWAGATDSFTTTVINLPALTLSPATSVGGISAILNGDITSTGNDTPTVIFYYGTSDGGTNPESWSNTISLGQESSSFSEIASNLSPTTTYYFTAAATNLAGTSWASSSLSFTTTTYTPPALVINEIHYDEATKTQKSEFIEIHNTSASAIDLSGYSFVDGVDYTFPLGTSIPAGGYLVIAQDPAQISSEFFVSSLGPWSGKLKNSGEHIEFIDSSGNLIDEVTYQLGFPWPTVGEAPSPSIELINPDLDNDLGGSWRSATSEPTPGAVNSTLTTNAPPHIRQVDYEPSGRVLPRDKSILPGEDVLITAKITDLDGVDSVTLEYQALDPGSYLSIDDPLYLTSWTPLAMLDDGTGGDALAGDSIYTVTIPAAVNTHRRLIRYRITAEDSLTSSVLVPYADDPSPNFTYFVYGSVPTWTADGTTYDFSTMEPVATYHLITTRDHHTDAQHISPASTGGYGGSDYKWDGALIYEGKVYDHIRYRARGGVWRYAMGKNMWKFDFNRGHRFQARDDYDDKYEEEWSKLNFSSLIQQGNFEQRGEQGLFEGAGFKNHNLSGNPAPNTHYVHFRIIEDATETGASQYQTDFQGLYMAVEQLGSQFADQHEVPEGYLWKIEGSNNLNPPNGQPTYLESDFLRGDVDDFIDKDYGSQAAESWWRDWLDLPEYYAFRANATWIHDYDIAYGKNYFYMHNPEEDNWRVTQWDLDLTWTTTYNGGGTTGPLSSDIFAIPAFELEYRNAVRHFQDLLHNDEQQGMLLDEIAHWVHTPSQNSFVDADRAMWDYNPILTSSYVNSGKAGHGRYYEVATSPSDSFEGMVNHLKSYVTTRKSFMTSEYLTDESSIPATPSITYTGVSGYPADDLSFDSSTFSSPASDTFAAQQWRIARITLPEDPRFDSTDALYDHFAKRHYEIEDDWTGDFVTSSFTVTIPASAADPGDLVRVRTRMQDSSGRWSHWSAPQEFIIGAPDVTALVNNLMISEIMYNPPGPNATEALVATDNDDFEFLELTNISATLTLDLSELAFTKGITFDFVGAAITSLAPGECVLLIKNLAAFQARYGTGLSIAGVYPNSLSNGGEQIQLSYAENSIIRDFEYDDKFPWPDADGSGYSMVLIDPTTAPDHSLATNWTTSTAIKGSPCGVTCVDFACWQADQFSVAQLADPLISGPSADPDGDGIENLLEHAFGTDPLAKDDLSLILYAEKLDDNGTDYFTLSYRRLLSRDHLTYIPEISPDLQAWDVAPGALTELSATDNNDGTETVLIRSNVPYASIPKEFMRIRVIDNP